MVFTWYLHGIYMYLHGVIYMVFTYFYHLHGVIYMVIYMVLFTWCHLHGILCFFVSNKFLESKTMIELREKAP